MASVIYNEFKEELMKGNVDLDGGTFRADLLMTNTTCDTENDAVVTNANFTTPDVCDGANYTHKVLSTLAVTKVDASDRATWGADNLTWTSLGAGTRQIQGVLIYKYDTNFNSSMPICFIQFSSNKTADGSDFTVSWDSTNKILYLT